MTARLAVCAQDWPNFATLSVLGPVLGFAAGVMACRLFVGGS